MKRRQFIKLSSAASVVALSPIQVQAAFKTLMPFIDCPDATNRKLVLIFLAGGNDGLNTLIPLNQYDSAPGNDYISFRPTVAIPKDSSLDINFGIAEDSGLEAEIGFHPKLTGIRSLYGDGLLRIIHSVGYPNSNKSHFKSTDFYMTGNDGASIANGLDSGWIGRYMEGAFADKIADLENLKHPLGLQLGSPIPALGFQGANNNGLSVNIAKTDTENFSAILGGLSGTRLESEDLESIQHTDHGKKLSFITNIDVESNKYATTISDAYSAGSNLATYTPFATKANDLSNQLQTVARLMRGGLETKIYMLQVNGFDTHSAQVDGADNTDGRHGDLLAEISPAIKAFMDDVNADSLGDDVVGLTFSEFGRKVAENDSLGTDHGEIAPMFVFGKPVKGGISGHQPDLSTATAFNNFQFEGERLYDYRQIFATLLQNFLGSDNTIIDNAFFDHAALESFTGSKVSELLKEDYDLSNCSTFSNNNPSEIEKKWLLHPNPVRDVVNFSTIINGASKVSFKVYNTSGALIMNKTSDLEAGQLNLNLKHFNSGLYFFQIDVGGKKEVHKVIKL